jgi:signal transduction histidine kinase
VQHRFGVVPPGRYVVLSVRDSGGGMTPDVYEHLFEPFFTTKSQGLGMGLAIVRSIVERHHGRVRAENLGAGGAIFKVTLPVSAPAAVMAPTRLLKHPRPLSVAG